MRIIVFSLFLLLVSSLVPNCAYQSNSKCLSCYYGFQLALGKCQKCSTGFIMVNSICISQGIYQQQQLLQQQLTTTSNNTSSITQQVPIVPSVSGSTSVLQTQTVQGSQSSNSVQTVSQTSNNIVSTSTSVSANSSGGMNFDISNTGVMYLLQLFGLTAKIPNNCQIFTTDFNCVKCSSGYILSLNGVCGTQSTTTVSSTTTGNVAISGSTTSSNSQSTTTNSGSAYNSGSSFSSYGSQATLVNNDPNCQTSNGDGTCYQCYYRYYYSTDTKKCLAINSLCATWDKLGSCLSCYSGYKIVGSNCLIENQSSTSSNTQSSQINSSASSATTSTSGSTLLISSDSNCRVGGSNGICSQCYYSYYFSSLSGYCVPVNPQCQTWNSLGYCLSCYQGYILSGTLCVIGSTGNNANSSTSTSSNTSTGNVITITTSSDPNCRSQNADGSCTQCYYSFYYESVSSKKCISVNPLCRTWNSNGYCLSCYQGYNLLTNTCVIQSAYQSSISVGVNDLPLTNQDPYCNTYKDQVCVKCALRTYYDSTSKRCLQIDANCKLWSDSGICTNCYDGYYIYNQKECRLIYPEVNSVQLKSALNTDINCRSSDSNGICTQCIWRFALNSTTKICMKVNDLCKTWSQISALCTGCYGGYSLTTGGQCKVSW